MTATWVPRTPGNWLFHCHFAFHVSHFLSFNLVPDPVDPGAPDAVDHSVHGMMGLILGIQVNERPGARRETPGARRQAPEIRKDTQGQKQIPRSARDDSEDVASSRARAIRLLVQAVPARYDSAPGYGFVAQETPAPIPTDSVPVLSPTLMLRRGEPVRITVVNHLRAPTAVHWHGIELADSYYDGVPGWSGAGARLAPGIAPRDSFVVEFTPPRAGTFIYHSHSNEEHQIASGLYGALIVLERGRAFDPTTDRIFVVGKDGPNGEGSRINGQKDPAEQTLVAGKTYRFRIVQINPDSRAWVSLMADSAVQRWRPLAKDGADLPTSQAVMVPATLQMGPGETADFEVTPLEPGTLRLDVVSRTDAWRVSVPLRVVRP
jgi:FtsP/CotA-like multicopper oxidase with cupredoxin domain